MRCLNIFIVIALIFTGGCTKMLTARLSYEYFDELYFYKVSDGVMLAYKSSESSLTVIGHEVEQVSGSVGSNYLIQLYGKIVSKEKLDKMGVIVHRLPDGFLGYNVKLTDFNSDVDRVYYVDSRSNKQYPVEKRTPSLQGAEGGGGSEEINP